MTGYRYRQNNKGSYIDVYLYDSLSSGAGYAINVSDNINQLLDEVKELLTACNCDASCFNCLKHYRNQHVHGVLDRYSALELLNWATLGILPTELSKEQQYKYIIPLNRILNELGYQSMIENDTILIKKADSVKELVVYPAMWKERNSVRKVYINDMHLKYAKPYAIDEIVKQMNN